MLPRYQCVPNLSEGRRPEVVEALADSVRSVPGAWLVDYSADPDHNRMVLSLLGTGEGLEEAVLRLFQRADDMLDISSHEGAHPRVGAVDVVPFIPLRDTPMERAVDLARRVASRVAQDYDLPVYLYERAAQRSDRVRLPDIRHAWIKRLGSSGAEPDYGPARLHPRLGASVIGARPALVAYNVLLDTSDLSVAKIVAQRVRERDGGLTSVRAMAVKLAERGLAQVSVNLTDPSRTSLYTVLEMVRMEARRFGVAVRSTEVVGLCPLETLLEAARYYLQLDGFRTEQVLEHQMLELAAGSP